MSIKGIDISVHQGIINFDKVKYDQNCGFIMIRAGYRGYGDGSLNKDNNYELNYQSCVSRGIPVGAYFFSQAKSYTEGVDEAKYMLKLIQGKKFQYPICIDTELSGAKYNGGRADNISLSERTSAVMGFCKTIEENGYYAMIYCSSSWLNTKLNAEALKGYDKWIAKWSIIKPAASYNCGIWQNSNNGQVNGIRTRVDTNIAYSNYPSIMVNNGLNGYSKVVDKVDKYDVVISNITNGDKIKFEQLAGALKITSITYTKK